MSWQIYGKSETFKNCCSSWVAGGFVLRQAFVWAKKKQRLMTVWREGREEESICSSENTLRWWFCEGICIMCLSLYKQKLSLWSYVYCRVALREGFESISYSRSIPFGKRAEGSSWNNFRSSLSSHIRCTCTAAAAKQLYTSCPQFSVCRKSGYKWEIDVCGDKDGAISPLIGWIVWFFSRTKCRKILKLFVIARFSFNLKDSGGKSTTFGFPNLPKRLP